MLMRAGKYALELVTATYGSMSLAAMLLVSRRFLLAQFVDDGSEF